MQLRELLLNLTKCRFLDEEKDVVFVEDVTETMFLKDKDCDCLSLFTSSFCFELNLDDLERDILNNYDGVFCMCRGDNRKIKLLSLMDSDFNSLTNDVERLIA